MRLGDIKRVQEIVTTLVKGGFSYYVHSSKLNKLTSLPCRIKCYYFKKCVCPVTKHSLPFQFREILEDLGPTFIKLGQLLSVRPDFIPYEYTEELRKLQDKARAAPFKDIKETIEKEIESTN